MSESTIRPITLSWDHCVPVSGLDAIKEDYLSKFGGIYLWLFNGKPLRVAYVGETAGFLTRLVTHLSCLHGSSYSVFDIRPEEDYVQFLIDHLLMASKDSVKANPLIYSPFANHKPDFSFQRAFGDQELRRIQTEYVKNLSFAFARILSDFEETPELRKEVEGSIIIGLRDAYVEEFDIKVPFKMPFGNASDTMLGRISKYPTPGIQLKHTGPAISALPPEVRTISGK